MEFLDFLFFAIIVFYIVRSVLRILLPRVLQNVVNKAQQQQANGAQQNYNHTQPGKIKVEYMPTPKKGSIPDSEGDFIDYEEIK